uniref:Lanosterol 14-alpha demethylase n=1 Tax=Hirondellea gigas TaxID=1518452 RepID=A0A2P2IAQ8_9CRUS
MVDWTAFPLLATATVFILSALLFFIRSPTPVGRAPRFSYLVGALLGRFNMKEEGAMDLLWAAYKKHGDMFTLKILHKHITILIGAEASAVMYNANDSEVSSKEIYSFTIPVFGKGIVYDAPTHIMAQQLKFVRHGLGSTLMETYCAKIANESAMYFNSWPDAGECDFHKEMSELTALSASRCLLGDEIRGKISKFGPLYQKLSDGLSHISVLFPYLPTKAHRERDKARAQIHDLFIEVIEKRREAESKSDDYLQLLIDSRYRDGQRASNDDIVGIMIATLFGGQHTSAITSTWVAFMIATHKEPLLKRLLDEQKEVLTASNGELSVEVVDSMKLLHLAVKETLRLFPPLIMLARTALKPLKYKEFVIPKGDILMTCPTLTQRLPEVFKNPDEFDPDRFAEPRKEDAERFAYQPFGGGRHMCLGNRFGYLQIKIVISVFLRMFEFELKDPNWKPKISYEAIVAGPAHGCEIKFKKRPKSEQFFI